MSLRTYIASTADGIVRTMPANNEPTFAYGNRPGGLVASHVPQCARLDSTMALDLVQEFQRTNQNAAAQHSPDGLPSDYWKLTICEFMRIITLELVFVKGRTYVLNSKYRNNVIV